jgi:integrase
MASITVEPNGRRTIQFVGEDRKRRSLRLGKVSQRAAEAVKLRVEHLAAARITGATIDTDTARWLAELPDELAGKLAAVGLMPKRAESRGLTLGEHLAAYIVKRTGAKPATVTHLKHTQRCLIQFFGAGRPLASITAGDARDWERWLRTGAARANRYGDTPATEGLATNTARKRAANAKQFFRDAIDRELIQRNPFAELKSTVGGNRERDYFVTRDAADKVLDACPDAEWRLIFALSRYAGLRCPSEHLGLTWDCIDWERGRIRVASPKTEHHQGGESRMVPLFPELRPHLEALFFDEQRAGTTYVITRYRSTNTNLRTQLLRIIRRAGVDPWPKLFQNLRASRATELAGEFPAHVAAAWLGHSTLVAQKHYWTVTDQDFERAAKSVQNPVQNAHESTGNAMKPVLPAHKKTPIFQGVSRDFTSLQCESMGRKGLEPLTSAL